MLQRRRKATIGRHSSSSRGALPSKRHHPGRSHGIWQGAGEKPSPMPRDRWRYSPLTSGDGGGKPGMGRLDEGVRDIIIIKERPGPGRSCGALPPQPPAGPPLTPSNKKAASSTVVAKMASLAKTLLAGSLFVFASVHAGVASHRDSSVLRARSNPVVTVKNGSYEGVHSSEYDQDFFLGMRYSQVRAEYVTHS